MSSVFLAEFLGFYILVVSVVFLIKYESFMSFARDFAEDTSLRYTVALVELAAGIGIVISHNVWELGYKGVVTALGWLLLLEAVFHLIASDEQESRVIESLDGDLSWIVYGVISVFLGVYLLTLGFTA